MTLPSKMTLFQFLPSPQMGPQFNQWLEQGQLNSVRDPVKTEGQESLFQSYEFQDSNYRALHQALGLQSAGSCVATQVARPRGWSWAQVKNL